MNEIILQASNISKFFVQGGKKIEVIDDAEFQIKTGSINIISGKSGSGKSTLLHLFGGLDKPCSGRIMFYSENIVEYSERKINEFRNSEVGFVFQFHHLLSDFTAYENIVMPSIIKGNFNDEKKKFAEYIIGRLGISERKNHFPNQMSGGEQQRTAIARSMINHPKLIFADEPTGNLDNETASDVIKLFWEINREFNVTIIIVTHDKNLADNSADFFELKNGKINIIKKHG